MLDSKDRNTFFNVKLLTNEIKNSNKPIFFWIGAGASAWCGYPLWNELVDVFHNNFNNFESNYKKDIALELIREKNYPQFFQYCKDTNIKHYNKLLSKNFTTKEPNKPYMRFIELLSNLKPLYILTTNVDQSLENNITGTTTIDNTDLERIIDFVQDENSFICKLHGSINRLKSLVFTTKDYETLLSTHNYQELLKYIFTQGIVIFLGYSLSDNYVLQTLLGSNELRPLLGDGPHFLVTSSSKINLNDNIKTIIYETDVKTGHRSAFQILDFIEQAIKPDKPKVSTIE